MPKFFVKNNQINKDIITITGEDVNHITNVLRLKKGDNIIVCDKDKNKSYNTKINDITKEKVECEILNSIKDTTESNIQVTLFQGLPKSDKMEYIIQKTTEIGIREIIPVRMKRCIAKIDKKDENKKIDRWQKIAEVASKQSGRDIIPNIKNVIEFSDIKEVISKFDLFICAYEEENEVSLKQVLKTKPSKIAILIGPEGGLDVEEVKQLYENGAKIITLGKRILRTETAPIVALSNIMYELE